MRKQIAAASVVLLVAIVAACGSSSQPIKDTAPTAGGPAAAGYHQVDPAGLKSMLAAKDFPLINVHIPYEGEIEGTDLFIPYDQIDAHLGELPASAGAKIVLYCRSGRMSTIAAEALVAKGYTDVWELKGGMLAWEAAGYPILQANH